MAEIFKFDLVKFNKHYGKNCPCVIIQSEDNICPCKEFRESGKCICGLFIKVNKNE